MVGLPGSRWAKPIGPASSVWGWRRRASMSFRLAPEQKDRSPAPVITSTWAEPSAAKASIPSARPAAMSPVTLLWASGRLSVISVTAPRLSTSSSSIGHLPRRWAAGRLRRDDPGPPNSPLLGGPPPPSGRRALPDPEWAGHSGGRWARPWGNRHRHAGSEGDPGVHRCFGDGRRLGCAGLGRLGGLRRVAGLWRGGGGAGIG